MHKKSFLFFTILAITTIVLFFCSILFGAHSVDIFSPLSKTEHYVIYELRMPRAILAFLIGGALSLSGAILQTLFRNPLADPSIIGVSSGAAFAAAAAIVLGGTWMITNHPTLNTYLLPIAAFLGGLLTTFIIVKISQQRFAMSLSIVLLTGIAINSLAGSGIGLLSYLATDTMLRSITFWMLGSLSQTSWHSVLLASIFILPVLIIAPFFTKSFNALLLGEPAAQHLGIPVEKVKRRALFLMSLSVGAAVALSGIIGFVGLVVPHMVRFVMGANHRFVIPGSILLGGNLLMLADMCARTWFAPVELPIGIITALIGAPFFLFLIFREKQL